MRIYLLAAFLLFKIGLSAQTSYLFIGTYTSGTSKGIYVYRFNSLTGKADSVGTAEAIANPSYLAIGPNQNTLYAVSETEKSVPGSVYAYEIERLTGKLKFLNKQVSGGDNPCYVTVHKNNKWVVIANYSGGSLSAFPILPGGKLKPLTQLIEHAGRSVNIARQEKAHVHSTVFSPDYKYLFTPDLGADKVFVYTFNSSLTKPLSPARTPTAPSEPGSGPRHFTFHPNKRFAYLIEELSGTVVTYKYHDGQLAAIQRLLTHPNDYKGDVGSADIHISADGKFLYASNRGGENTITIFSIDDHTGKLTVKGFQSTLGIKPRNFTLDNSGKYLLVANQESNNIVIFKRDQRTGLLTETGEQILVPSPVCLKMMK